MPENILSVRDLVVRRSEQTVLQVNALDIQAGEVLAVIGPNGAGKSTLLLVLANLLEHQGGQVCFHGQPLEKMDELAYRRSIALVLQEPLLLHRSVFDNVATGLTFRGLPKREVKQRTESWLKQLGIDHLRTRPAQHISGGEAQRTSLARAFALQPELLFLDEPFSALDAPTRFHLLQDMKAILLQTTITTVFITHDLDEALLLGDRVAVLLGGVMRQVGVPQEVFGSPVDAEVAAFVGVETVMAGVVTAANNGQLAVAAGGIMLEAVGDLPVGAAVYYCLRPEDITLSISADTVISSARNRLTGHITQLTPTGPLVRVVVDCGLPVVALITRSSANDMHLVRRHAGDSLIQSHRCAPYPPLND